jgi:hypothetical protein
VPARTNRPIRTSRNTGTPRGSGRRARGGRGRRSLPHLPLPLLLLLVFAVVAVGVTAVRALGGSPTTGGAIAETAARTKAFLDYMAGVFTLLALTAAVVFGLAATDRLLLTPRRRVALQSAHRAAAAASLGFLAVHIAVKVYDQEATPLAALVPFAGGANLAVGLGVVAADLMVFVAVTGVLRGRFAAGRRPWLWRAMHGTAYASWPVALAHGLSAGREAAEWVFWGYGLCAAAVALALAVRLLGALGHRSAARRTRHALRAYEPGLAPGRGGAPAGTGAGAAEEQLLLATHATLAPDDGTGGTGRPGWPTAVPVYGTSERVPVPEFRTGSAPQPSPWPGEQEALPHPALVETPPHGFTVPVFPQPPQYVPDWIEDSGSWGPLTWDTPPQGIPRYPYAPVPEQQGRGW